MKPKDPCKPNPPTSLPFIRTQVRELSALEAPGLRERQIAAIARLLQCAARPRTKTLQFADDTSSEFDARESR